jgi:membrane protein required for colicin V production
MNWLDIVIIIGLIISLIMGLRSGLIMMLFMLAGTIIGLILAGQYSDSLALKLTFISDFNIAGIIAFLIIFLGTLLVAWLLALLVQRITKFALLDWLNRVGGAIFGLLLGAIFIGAILAMYMRYMGNSETITGSPLATFLINRFWVVLGLLPSQFDHIQSYF